ncbi:uncharacterized protein LOC132552306 [Ylistrum balloti]|uniref:uncharacterized protein LOC132552306 n=1 Tax=Ylistrum balloti TaxID=509963 RepID=UPI0029059BC1|nr:uncharacterized protein LOC132552306 [Ylistrum balloti]
MSCIDLSLSNDTSGDVVLMVASCPPDTTSEMNQACSEGDNGNKITNVPVSTPSENVIFRNKYCASCHGHESNFTKWTFNIECDSIVDINHLSSYDEIYQTGLDNMCRMTYHTSNKNSFISCSSGHTTFPGFKGCNMTGQWATYETSIDWACRNIMAPYRGFNNIFCFACNPDKQSDRTIISGCNVTGMWDPYDSDLEKACLQYPYSQIAYPFKNRFCYLCNRGNDILSTFMDADSSLSLEVWEIHKVNAYEGKLRIDSLQHEKQFHVNLSAESTASLSPDRFNADVNVSKLLSHHFLHYGYHGFCPDKAADLDHTNQQCSCSLTCLNTTRCCAEFALNAPLTYVNEFKHSLSVSKCYGKNSVLSKSTVQERCETIQPLKGFYKIPVRSLASGILYSNIYCFLCNEGQKTRNDSEIEPDYNPLDLKIKCNYTFQTERYIFLEDMLNDFDRMSYDDGAEHCTVSTVYDLYVDNELISDTINRCNVTGHWDLYDSDIEWACLNYIREITGDLYNGFYQNMFCEMCNTASDSGFKYTTCNATNSSISDYCEKYPHITSMKPFKNIFCKICNYIPLLSLPPLLSDSMTNCDSNGIEIGDVMFDLPRFFSSTVREIFFFSMAPEFPDQIKNAFKMYGNRCMENEIYDKEKVCILLQTPGGLDVVYRVPIW